MAWLLADVPEKAQNRSYILSSRGGRYYGVFAFCVMTPCTVMSEHRRFGRICYCQLRTLRVCCADGDGRFFRNLETTYPQDLNPDTERLIHAELSG